MRSCASANCGTHFGWTNEATSMSFRPASTSRLMNSAFRAVGIVFASFCSPSRGPTSTIRTLSGRFVIRQFYLGVPFRPLFTTRQNGDSLVVHPTCSRRTARKLHIGSISSQRTFRRKQSMRNPVRVAAAFVVIGCLIGVLHTAVSQQVAKVDRPSSYLPVDQREPIANVMSRMKAAKAEVMRRHMSLLEQRYDLSDRAAKDVKMSRNKAVQEGVRVKLARGLTWEQLAGMTPADIRDKDLYPAGFMPLPHPNHPEGGMLFPRFMIDEILRQEQRDLTR